LTALAVFCGIVSLLTLYPRVTITTTFETKEPLSSSFLISNDGYLPAYAITVYCLVDEVGVGSAGGEGLGNLTITIKPTFVPSTDLVPGAKELVPWSNCITPKAADRLSVAHVGLHITYKPLLWPWKRSFTQEFYAKDNGGGGYILYSIPYSK
jgi:hypothetical protein